VQIVTLSGTIVYRNPAGLLEAGWYSLPVQVNNIKPGSYFVKLLYSNGSSSKKL